MLRARLGTLPLALFGLCTLVAPASTASAQNPAQTITIRLLNGKSGKPLPNKNVTFHWGDTDKSIIVTVDANGIGHVTVPPDTAQFILVEGPMSKDGPHSIAFEDCNATSSTPISVALVVAHGFHATQHLRPQNRALPPRRGSLLGPDAPLALGLNRIKCHPSEGYPGRRPAIHTTDHPLPQAAVDRIVRQALDEDAPWGDLTSQTLIPAEARVKASLIAREHGVLAGIQLFAAAMRLTDPTIEVITQHDAQPFFPGDILATAEGPARSVLQAERVALNFVQRLSGIATLTAQYVEQIKGTEARIVDTRKTTPTLRLFERYAVRCGGGHNHRYSLSDAMLVKDNHLAVLAAQGETDLTAALQQARKDLPHTAHLEVEVDRLDQIEPVLAAGVDTILVDNFTPDQLRAAVRQIAGRALVEASGNVRLDTVRAIAETGVDLISAGALTHSVRSVDLGLDILAQA